MKKYVSIGLSGLWLVLILVCLMTGCKKEDPGIKYTITWVERPGSLDCLYTAKAPGEPDWKFPATCGKYKTGQTLYKPRK